MICPFPFPATVQNEKSQLRKEIGKYGIRIVIIPILKGPRDNGIIASLAWFIANPVKLWEEQRLNMLIICQLKRRFKWKSNRAQLIFKTWD